MESERIIKLDESKDLNQNGSEEIEHIADLIGPWGPFQRRIFFILAIVFSISPFSNASLTYYLTKSDFYCVSQDSFSVTVCSTSFMSLDSKFPHRLRYARTQPAATSDHATNGSTIQPVQLSSKRLVLLAIQRIT